jgi:cathepsin H
LYSLSEQQLVDCAGNFDNHGCNGGLPSHAFEYVHYQGGIQTETTYPYEAVDRPCRFKADSVVVKTVRSVNITSGDEDGIVTATAEAGPVSIAYQVVSVSNYHVINNIGL